MSGTLGRDDIVGKRIGNIYQSTWDIDPDGFGARSTYIELQDGMVFELQSQDAGIHPISAIDLVTLACCENTEPSLSQCIGQTVVEVLASCCWPGIGVLLSNNHFIYQRDFFNQNRSGSLLIGGYAERVGERFTLDDVIPYWEQRAEVSDERETRKWS